MITTCFDIREKNFQEFSKERLKEILELTNETNFDLIYYYKNMSRKKFYGFDNAINVSKKIRE